MKRISIFLAMVCSLGVATVGDVRPIDAQQSHLTVRVEKTGLLAAMAHNHNISAPILRGRLDRSIRSSVSFEVNAAALRVTDTDISDSDRSEMQKRMLGPEVLDVTQYPVIHFVSDRVESTGPASWRVFGRLTLHGQTKPVVLEARLQNGHYRGTATISQSNFGVPPIKVAGGTIRVKDEVQIEYDIVLAGK